VQIAIVGTGISGLYTGHRLHADHDITLYEAKSCVGGHSHTVDVELAGQTLAIDTGFIVFNERNYPRFTAMLDTLNVPHQASDMSFGYSCRETGLEYRGGPWLVGLFSQRINLLRPSFHRMLRGILRLNSYAEELATSSPELSLGEFLAERRLGGAAVDNYLLPMAGAIWSAEPSAILDFPARQFGTFFCNHGLLQVRNRVVWRTVSGGSREYVKALTAGFRDRIQLATPVEWIQRLGDQVLLKARGQSPRRFDAVVLACHSDQALRLLRDPSEAERDILGAIPYQPNETVLHTDKRLLPARRKAWAAWNYHRFSDRAGRATVTYNLTTLQSLPTDNQFLVTLNTTHAIDPTQVIARMVYDHPVFNRESLSAQQRVAEINGGRRTYYCGAYWGNGFHEDGVNSSIAACDAIEKDLGHQELYLQRTG
jgi:predicted NAD/FAD-binding protein